jgi:hypothetical protein
MAETNKIQEKDVEQARESEEALDCNDWDDNWEYMGAEARKISRPKIRLKALIIHPMLDKTMLEYRTKFV